MIQEIKAKLSLDDAEFSKKLSANEKSVLKFSASVGAIATAATAAAVSTAAWQDQTGKLAQAAGTSAVAFSKLSVAAEKSNVSQEELAKSLGKISAASPEMAGRLAKVGIGFTDASGKAKSSADVFADVAEKVALAGTTAQKSAIAVRVFGDEGAKLVPLLAGGRKGLAEAAAEAQKYGLVVSEEAAAAAALFNDQMAETKNALKGLVSSLGESVIAWSNQGGVMDAVRNGVAFVTQAWRGLDETTKNDILTAGAVVTALGGIVTAMIAIRAIAPSVGSALSKMFGPIGLVVQGIVAAVSALAVGFAKYGHTLDTITVPANKAVEKSMTNVSAMFNDFPQTASDVSTAMVKVADSAGKIERPLSVIGTATAWITKQFSLAKVGWASAIEYVLVAFQGVSQKMPEYKAMFSGLFTGNVAAAAQAANRIQFIEEANKQAREEIVRRYAKERDDIEKQSSLRYEDQAKKTVATAKKTAEGIVQAFGPTSAQWANPVITAYRDVGLAALKLKGAPEAAIAEYQKKTEALQASTTTAATQTAIGWSKIAEAAVAAITPAINAASMITDAMAKATQYAAKVAARDLEVQGIRAQKAYDEQKASLDAQHASEVADINATYDAKLAAVENGEAAITAAIELARNQRLLADDAEYLAAVEKLRQQYADKLALIDQNSLDLEQRRLNDAVAEQSFQTQLADLAASFAGKKDKTNKDFDAKTKAQQTTSADATKKLEADKNAALEAEQKRADLASKTLDEKKAADDKALEKQKLQTQYDAELQEFNQTKAVKSVQTVASGIAAAASAFAATAGALPFGLGIPIGLAIAGTILGATYASVAQINSQEPVKPAALIAAKGGTLMGETHNGPNGGVDVKASRGETILTQGLTNRLDNFLPSTGEGSGGQNYYFQDGAIRVLELSEDTLRKLASMIGDETRRGGLALA